MMVECVRRGNGSAEEMPQRPGTDEWGWKAPRWRRMEVRNIGLVDGRLRWGKPIRWKDELSVRTTTR